MFTCSRPSYIKQSFAAFKNISQFVSELPVHPRMCHHSSHQKTSSPFGNGRTFLFSLPFICHKLCKESSPGRSYATGLPFQLLKRQQQEDKLNSHFFFFLRLMVYLNGSVLTQGVEMLASILSTTHTCTYPVQRRWSLILKLFLDHDVLG